MLSGTIPVSELRHGHHGLAVVHPGAPVAGLVLLPHEATPFPQVTLALVTAPDKGLVSLPLAAVVTPGPSGTISSGSHFGGALGVACVVFDAVGDNDEGQMVHKRFSLQ